MSSFSRGGTTKRQSPCYRERWQGAISSRVEGSALSGAEGLRINSAVAAHDPAPDPALARPRLRGEPLIGSGQREASRSERRREAGAANPRESLARQGRSHVGPRRGEVEVYRLARLGQRRPLASTPVTA